ncbi:cyclopropane-fatty-acyl-phospholipid synthase family protein [Methylophilus sp.]|jgi:cyclopropane-fatty-acyl-phospholipid synthase|uniref:SAM-dependent methyltransferase n=1 Tax=Methylophilus sp. TaxID=29541 RepID=UPI0011D4DD67|nr:cyclopropane-fatty-acyl-phospholipid synthase family protein [Methylophilus sp.]TXI46479.1 MAG: class I SAM-dependent methyltransferase [Methylophilus sp.]
MSPYPVQALAMSSPLQPDTNSDDDMAQARYILNRLFQGFADPFAVRLWNGRVLTIGDGAPVFTFCLEQASVLRDMVWFSNPQRLLEAYCAGELQIHGDFHAAMQLREHVESLCLPLHEKLGLVFRALTLADRPHAHQVRDIATARAAATARTQTPSAMPLNDEVADAFYQYWLDEQMLYSCAYFTGAGTSLSQAQQTQLTLICQKLRLQHGETLLDMSCGWGGLACWAAKHYGVFVHGITTNPAQYAYATRQVQQQGLTHLVKIALAEDDRLPALASYDKAVFIGIAEQIGAAQYPAFLAKVYAALKPGGLFLSHVMTTEHVTGGHTGSEHAPRPQEAASGLINRQRYPAGELTSFAQVLQHMDNARFDVFNVEGLRRHYMMTLREWLKNLEAQHASIAANLSERTYRIWRLALTASVIQFEQGVTGMHQVLATRRCD